MKRYAYLVGACVGILFLYFLATLSQPVVISIDEIAHFEGKRVIVRGILIDKSIVGESEILIIKNGSNILQIFSTFSSHTSYGDEIEVLGKVEKYKGQWEVIAEEIEVIKKWDKESIPLWELSEHAAEYDKRNVNVTGYVEKIYSAYFILTDEKGYRIKVFYPYDYNISTIKEKDYPHVYVKAFFQYDESSFSFSLNIESNEHGIKVLK